MLIKKILASTLTVAMLCGVLTACGGGQQPAQAPAPATDPAAPAVPAEPAPAPAEPASAEKKQLTVWHIWDEADEGSQAKAFLSFLDKYRADNPDVELLLDAVGSDQYKPKIKTAVMADEAPDVFFAWGAGFVSPFVRAGKVLALDPYLQGTYKDNIIGGTLDNFVFDGSTYGLTFYQWVGALFCNQEMFNAAGAKIPATYDDLLAAVSAFKAQNVVPLALGVKDTWTAMFFQNIMAIRTAGAAATNKMLAGEATFDVPEIAKSAQYVDELVKAGAFDPGCMALSYDEVKMSFLMGEIPMIFMGDWLVGEIQDPNVSMVKDKVVAVNFPATNDGQDPSQVSGGAIDGFCVSQNAKDIDLAVDFVLKMTEYVSEEGFAIGGGIPTRKFDTSKYTVDPLAKQIMDYAANSTGAVLAWDTFLEGEATQRHLSLIEQIFAQQITPQEFASEMAKVQ